MPLIALATRSAGVKDRKSGIRFAKSSKEEFIKLILSQPN
jgi:hypothetical protein